VVSNRFYFPFHIWDVILPIDELIVFKIVIAPPTRYTFLVRFWSKEQKEQWSTKGFPGSSPGQIRQDQALRLGRFVVVESTQMGRINQLVEMG